MELSKEERQRIALDYLQELQGSNPAKLTKLEGGDTFAANGKIYTVSDSFNVGRFDKVEELEEELIMVGDKRTCHEVMASAMGKINEFNPGEAFTLMYNKIESDQRNARLTHYLLRMCAVYINYQGEDVRYLTDETIKQKVSDWSAEGLPIAPFLIFAAGACREVLTRFKNPLVHLLNEAKEMSAALAEVLDIRNLTGEADSGLVPLSANY